MARSLRGRARKLGLPPGTPVHVGERKAQKVVITVIDYNETELVERELESVQECSVYKARPTVTWINVDGLHDIGVIESIGEQFGLHPLILEDIAHTAQRPKMEDYEDHLFVVLKMLSYLEPAGELEAEQVSIVLSNNLVISFQERQGDVFDSVRERIRTAKGRIRKTGADYLVYSLMDAVVDNYFVICEKMGEKIEPVHETLVGNPSPKVLHKVHLLKSEVLSLRKSVWPLREVVSGLERAEVPFFKKETRLYLRDVYDHTIQVIDTIETSRDMIAGMVDLYLSSVSNKMNEVMKVLTIIATIFIPLSFVAGLYGMNFDRMPELHWAWGYPAALFVMFSIAAGMLLYFRRKGWL